MRMGVNSLTYPFHNIRWHRPKDPLQALALLRDEGTHIDEPLQATLQARFGPLGGGEAIQRVGPDNAAVRVHQGDDVVSVIYKLERCVADDGDVVLERLCGRLVVVAGGQVWTDDVVALLLEEADDR